MSGSSGGGARLVGLTKQLEQSWREARERWQDAKAAEFEERFMKELNTAVNVTSAGIDNLERILRNLRNDCE